MNSFKNFSEKHPVALAVLTFVFMFGLLRLMRLVPESPFSFAIKECIMAVIVFVVTFLFMGKEKVSLSTKGFGYAFKLLRGYYVFLIILTVVGILNRILGYVVGITDYIYQLIPFINVFIACLFVGVIEEFSFRGLIFGGLLQKFGNAKNSIILAAMISGLTFGVLHILSSVLDGEVATMGAASTAILKILQTGIFGVVLAFVYYKTRNLFVVAVLHSLDDFLIFVATGAGSTSAANYVASDMLAARIGIYLLFTLILVPSLIRCIRDLKPGELMPFDEGFLPRTVAFENKVKKRG